MEQHPVPQQISSYSFKLVGDMTLKQFFQLAGGSLAGLLTYASPLPAIFKWPLIVIFVLLGAALAFLPIEERPLEVWIIAFLRSIYSPTQYVWRKPTAPPVYFTPDVVPQAQVSLPTYANPQNAPIDRLEEAEKTFFSRLTSVFSLPHAPVKPTASMPELKIPTSPPPKVEKSQVQPVSAGASTTGPIPIPNVQTSPVSQTLPPASKAGMATPAQFSAEASPPMPPSLPNVIVGQVLDTKGAILEGAILEIKDTAGRPVRALKTNKAGHFFIVTPLTSGNYEIAIEKPGFTFDSISLVANGQIIEPLKINAKSNA